MSYVLSETKPEFQRESTAEILFAYNFFGSGFDIWASPQTLKDIIQLNYVLHAQDLWKTQLRVNSRLN